jgi:hypothetical protein
MGASEPLAIDVELTGIESLVRMMVLAGAKAPEALGQALYQEGQLAFRQSQKEVPVKLGNLKGSGRLWPPTVVGGNVEIRISYGSTAVTYAAAVHERNKKYKKGRKWKYVYDPVTARVNGLEGRLGKRIARILEA